MRFISKTDYHNYLRDQARLPSGFFTQSTHLDFTPPERPVEDKASLSLSFLGLEKATESFAGLFTRNALAGAPILLNRQRLAENRISGILCNNKISNVGVGSGPKDVNTILAALSKQTNKPVAEFMVASTGVIGWRLPVAEICSALPDLDKNTQKNNVFDFAGAIMTTDSYPKAVSSAIGQGRVTVVSKGAAMIEPNLATMLVFALTDIAIPKKDLQSILIDAVEKSLNYISIDSDQSTSDMVVALSSNQINGIKKEEFSSVLSDLMTQTARLIVGNGEGVGHVIEAAVTGAENPKAARAYGKALINSPLVKTAIAGNDPNVGRLMSAVGDYGGSREPPLDINKVTLRLGGQTIFKGGAFCLDQKKEKILSDYLRSVALPLPCPGFPAHQKRVKIDVDLGSGDYSATCLGSDLTQEYVRKNADYRS